MRNLDVFNNLLKLQLALNFQCFATADYHCNITASDTLDNDIFSAVDIRFIAHIKKNLLGQSG